MRESLLFLLLSLTWPTISAQVESPSKNDSLSFVSDKMPQFVGGNTALIKYLKTTVICPTCVFNDEINGTVFVKFIIDKNGKPINPVILRGLNDEIDSIAYDLILNMPDWLPAEQNGVTVDYSFILPVKFNISKRSLNNPPKPSSFWGEDEEKLFIEKCVNDYGKSNNECDCWFRFIVWNYNNVSMNHLDFDVMFSKYNCK